MTAGEVVGLSLTVAFFAFLLGALVVASRGRGEFSRRRDCDTRLAKLAIYLSARRAVTRASLTFVASFRALGVTRETSHYMRLRLNEAHASRRRLHNRLDALDQAEANFIVWFPELERAGDGGRRVDVAALRAAIEGTQADVATLAKCLRDADRLAAVQVRDRAKILHQSTQYVLANDLVQVVRSLLDRVRR